MIPTRISGCFEVLNEQKTDERGYFQKIYHENCFSELNLETSYKEIYYSQSNKDVLRGLHFQTPPNDHVKVVHCVVGKIFDVVVDLRQASPTYGEAITFDLSADDGRSIYIPKGLAHGFYVKSESAIVIYKVSSVYSPENDTGILWSSINVDWPSTNPIISSRDKCFDSITKFVSPF